jgi:nucleotide-binding universal stress UspA family protein
MGQFTNMGVFLSGAPADEAVLEFAAHMARLGTRRIYCIHLGDAGPFSMEAAPDLAALQDRVKAALPREVAEHTTCEVQLGRSLIDLYQAARDKDLDLIIVGRRLPSSQLGIGAKFTRIARKSPCSVLVVPEQCRPHFDRILVAVDCSPHSGLSMEAAVDLAKASTSTTPQLVALTVRHVDARHDLAGVSFKESVDAQRHHGQRELEAFIADIDIKGLSVECLVTLSDEPSEAIAEVATVRKMDIVVIGSRGPTRPVAALLGSTSERVLMSCPMPVLITKEKGETLRLLEAIFTMD